MQRPRDTILAGILLFLLFLLVVPAFWLSLTTGFSLIDDYGDWKHIEMFGSGTAFLRWLENTFIHPGPGRFRPVFEAGNAVAWALFGEAAWLHHFWRWVIKALTLLFIVATVGQTGKGAGLHWIPIACLFLLFPNNPEARLAPQELSSGLGLMILVYAWVGRFYGQPLSLLVVLCGSVLLFFSKESNIVFFPILLLSLLFPRPAHQEWKVIVFLVMLFLYCIWRLSLALAAGGYGVPSAERSVIGMLHFVLGEALLFDLGYLPGLGMLLFVLLPIFLLKEENYRLPVVFLYLLGFCALAIGVFSWAPVTRYWYLFVPVSCALLGIFLSVRRTWFGPVSAVVLLLIAFMAGPYLFNFVAQNSSTAVEKALLRELDERLTQRQSIAVKGDAEASEKIRIYFEEFRPRMQDKPALALATQTGARLLVSTEKEAGQAEQEFREERPFVFERAVIDFSLALQRKQTPHLFVDAGVFFPYSYAWTIYRKLDG
ncbi:MAG: hypothetical protein HS115_20430 [Spirochaetales bacterium]|nr:hypothetical protein [Spirochaetales bacterium]